MNKLKVKLPKPRDPIARDLGTSKYRMRIAQTKASYNRQVQKQIYKKELAYV